MFEIKDLCISFGRKKILNRFSLSLPDSGVYALMGASGCGKTTLFSAIAGLTKTDSGSIDTGKSKISYDFQEPRLLPWMSALDNVNLVLGGKPETLDTCRKWLASLGLANDCDKLPSELSGGMQKRVALARTFAYGGDIYLLDEPLSGIDAETKRKIYPIIADIAKNHLVLFITHDSDESAECAEKILYFHELNNK